jgi:hypothetical protein
MSARGSMILLAICAVLVVVHEALLALASHEHVAHQLLGAGNGAPPIGAAVLALSLLVVRLVAIVLVPGAILASLASLFAHVAVGPIDRQRESAGTGTSSGAGSSVADGTGTSMEARGTV